MSKNFELLQQIGNEEELFRTARQSKGAVPAANADSNPELDKAARWKILQNASLPDVFQTASETPGPILAVCCEASSDVNEEVESASPPKAVPAGEYRNSRNASSSISDPRKHTGNGVTPGSTKSDPLSRTFNDDRNANVYSAVAGREAPPRVEI